MKQLIISSNTPRNFSETNINMSKDLLVEYFICFYFFASTLFLAGLTVYLMYNNTIKYTWSIFSVFLVVLSYLFFKRIKTLNQKVKMRKKTFNHGTIITAKVLKHDRKFVYYKSARNYLLILKDEKTDNYHKIDSKSIYLWNLYPVGSTIIGLKYNNNYFFPQSLNYQFTVK